jgi:hypothetical protein
MIVSFFARGVGAGKGPVRYCIDTVVPKFDPLTRERILGEWVERDPPPEVLRGNPERTIDLIDSIDNKWKYSSGVLAFADTDRPTEADQQQLMDDFEKTYFAGLEPDRYDILWIRHRHEGNIELHFVVPRVELLTGKALNIAPPGSEDLHDAWRDRWNFSKGWASPTEPDRTQMTEQDTHDLKFEAMAKRQGIELTGDAKADKRAISEYLLNGIDEKLVVDRTSLVAYLEEVGIAVNRQGKDYISVRTSPDKPPLRLKGLIYDAKFAASYDHAAAIRDELGIPSRTPESQEPARQFRNSEDDAARVIDATATLDRIVSKRSEYNSERYRQPAKPDRPSTDRPLTPDPERSQSNSRDIGQQQQPDNRSTDRSAGADQGARPANQRDLDQSSQPRQDQNGREPQDLGAAAEPVASRDPKANQAIAMAPEVASINSSEPMPVSSNSDMGLVASPVDGSENRNAEDGQRAGLSIDNKPRLDDLPSEQQKLSLHPNPTTAAQKVTHEYPAPPAYSAPRSLGQVASLSSVPRLSARSRLSDADTPGQNVLPGHAPSQLRQPRTSRIDHLLQQARDLATRLKGAYDRTRDKIISGLRNAWSAIQGGQRATEQTSNGLAKAVDTVAKGTVERSGRIGAAAWPVTEELDRRIRVYGEAIERSIRTERATQSASQQLNSAVASVSANAKQLDVSIPRTLRVLKMNRNDELTRFKTDINLVEFAEHRGYQIDKYQSSRASTVMRRGDDKIIVATDKDGHGIYFSVRDDSDHGSIIDFVQSREHLNLGQVRKELRPWIGENRPIVDRKPPQLRPRKPVATEKDRHGVLSKWMQMQPLMDGHEYLESRGLDPVTITDPRFAPHIREDGQGRALFAHYDRDGLCGYEIKGGVEGSRFVAGGTKAVWHSTNLPAADRIVICESAIDCLSHAQMFPDPEAGYVSIGGGMSDYQQDLLKGLMAKATDRGAEIVIAVDDDVQGDKYVQQLQALAPANAKIRVDRPPGGAGGGDWNAQLQAQLEAEKQEREREQYDVPGRKSRGMRPSPFDIEL